MGVGGDVGESVGLGGGVGVIAKKLECGGGGRAGGGGGGGR